MMEGQDYKNDSVTAAGAAEKRTFVIKLTQIFHIQIRFLGYALILFAGFLVFSSCSGRSSPLSVGADLVRLMDVFPRFAIVQTPEKQPQSADTSKDTEAGLAERDIFLKSINQDFVKGSPVHPLKLKFTKNPGNGSPLGRQTRNVILASPPTTLGIAVRLKREYVLRFEFAVIGEGWGDRDEKISFAVLAEDLKTGKSETVYKTAFNPRETPQARRWLKGQADLSSYREKSIRLEFKTSASDPLLAAQAAAWANPVLAAKDAVSHGPDIILISADTLRADHLGCYGYPRATTPAIDRLAARSCRFEHAISQAPYTVSSHMSMLTSLYPSFHKVNKIDTDRLDSVVMTLAETLYNEGYRTWGMTGGGQVSSNYGFAEGFESYMEFTSPEDDVRKKVAGTIEFLEDNQESPAFIFFHTYKPHPPYRPLPPYDTMFDPGYTGTLSGDFSTITAINNGELKASRSDLDHLISLYDGDIREMDDQLDELFTYLQKREDETGRGAIIVFTSDHGEEFGEHGKYGIHSHTLFHELVSVPLIIHSPHMIPAEGAIPDLVQSIDIYPTVLELAGVKPSGLIQGRSLLPLMKKGTQSSKIRPAFSERIPADSPWIRSLRTLNYCYMFREDKNNGTVGQLYFNLLRDPKEQDSLDLPDSRIRILFNQIRFLIDEGKKPGKEWGKQELDAETLEIMRSLGYIR
jgi:arylsulfatase A-like enzyme